MAKSTGMVKANWTAFLAELVASILFIATWWTLWSSNAAAVAFSGAAAFWLPIFVGFGIVGSISLFFLSFGNATGGPMEGMQMMNMWALKATAISAVTLIVWAWPSQTWVWVSIVGFVLGFIGTWMAAKDMM